MLMWEGIFLWLPKGSFRTLKTELRRVLEGWKECSRMEIKWEINYGVRKDSKSTFGARIPGEGAAISYFSDIICNCLYMGA